ncbi:MAG: hypothetical protein U5K00_21275 [Melioribacteraceae bacterium]|nr:hypothetical protein [Melioribacteraceae bacterium]
MENLNGIFDFEENATEKFGIVESVDTANIIITVEDEDKLKKMQVNHLIVIQSSKVGQHLIALVSKIMRNSSIESVDDENAPIFNVKNVIKATLIGTHIDKFGTRTNVFKRTLETVPENRIILLYLRRRQINLIYAGNNSNGFKR